MLHRHLTLLPFLHFLSYTLRSNGGSMQFPNYNHPITGITIPVGALKSSSSCGIGEYRDLKLLADFCKKTGLDVIQLLPVNDTGTESSPYSALSAFALHPVYISLDALPEARDYSTKIRELCSKYEDEQRFPYRALYDAKMDILRQIYASNEKSIQTAPALTKWIKNNPWISEYAVFMNLKHRNSGASWKHWHSYQTPTHAEIKKRWESSIRKSDHLFYAWLQMRLDEQFEAACAYCQKKGIAVKGDIPILMNEDSCDAWANPEFFRVDLRAGNPPDDLNPLGQNWGFPIYNWDNLRVTGFDWWKKRIANCDRYYNAYRIDHILGFFRIWSIPQGNESGYLGWTTPLAPITTAELFAMGFSGERLRWITEPHVPTKLVEEVNNYDYLGTHGLLQKLMTRVGNEELWIFKPELHNEQDIRAVNIPEPVQDILVRCWRDRLLQECGRDDQGRPLYAPVWNYHDSTAWKTFSGEERALMEELLLDKNKKNEMLWGKQGLEILSAITKSTKMLACAEDLGSIPECVPSVLEKLNILSLKVLRWEREWEKDGQPLRPLESYIQRSVTTTSVHDSSTLRGWWEQENGAALFEETGITIPKGSKKYTPEIAAQVLAKVAQTPSAFLLIPAQDFLDLDAKYYPENPEDSRINIPGTVTEFNWTWRMPDTLENLIKNNSLVSAISTIVKQRQTTTRTQGAEK